MSVLPMRGFQVSPHENGTPRTAPGDRLVFVDVLNVVSCLAVVALHVSLSVFIPERTSSWVIDIWFQGCSIFAVPVFFMVSGANLLTYRERYSTGDFFYKRLKRVGVALLGGSVLCYIAFCLWPMGFYAAESYAGAFSLPDFINRFMTNRINDTYWFLYKIIYLYLLTPLFSLALTNKSLMRYLLCLVAIASIGFPAAKYLGAGSAVFSSSLAWPLFSDQYLLYYLLGGYFARYYRRHDEACVPCLLLFIGSTVLMVAWALVVNGYFSDSLVSSYLNYPISTTSPLCALQAIALYLFFNNLETRLRRVHGSARCFLSRLSSVSLVVYLVHILFINAQPKGRFAIFGTIIHSNKCVELISVYLLSAAVGVAWEGIKKFVSRKCRADETLRLTKQG